MSFKEIFTATMILFAVIDIIGSIPVVISLREKVGKIESEKATIVASIIMIAFLFIGEEILNLIGIDINSFAVAGSIVIFFLALEMILGITLFQDDQPETASIVPIAFPVIAGAGTLTTLLSLRAEFEVTSIIAAILILLRLRNPRRMLSKLTTPSLSANRVSSFPFPTFNPGRTDVPLCRMRIDPAVTASPP